MFDKLVDLLLNCLGFFKFWVVVEQYERVVVLRLGKLNRELGPGIHPIWPFAIEHPPGTPVVPQPLITGPLTVITRDGQVAVATVVTMLIVLDVPKALLSVERYHDVVDGIVAGATARFIATHTWAEVRGLVPPEDEAKPLDADNEITKAVRSRAKRFGIGIESVVFRDLTTARSLRLIQERVGRVAGSLGEG